MSYFSDNYEQIRLPLASSGERGFRTAQLGAIHAIAAHFSMAYDPAVVTMPTGSGKTDVLIAAAYFLRSERVLVITPSRAVREQIAEKFKTLDLLLRIGALPEGVARPQVQSVRSRVTSMQEWDSLRHFDVVVANVQSISPSYADIPEPPTELFDTVFVDEAHHAPARSWRALLDHFGQAKRVLFTATPFRNDRREIKGKFIFTYHLRQARTDGIFGQIQFEPVTPAFGPSEHDKAIAVAAERRFREDSAAGLDHLLLVRTDKIARAKELQKVYQENTDLRLELITGQHSLNRVRKTLAALGSGELDGVICVQMLGEGFDLPRLKIAAVHVPHKSLPVTLQFIGRFARTSEENIGGATFLAVPADIEHEIGELYESEAVWQEIVSNLSAARITDEVSTREELASFDKLIASVEDLADLSLYSLEPYRHLKVYRLSEEPDFQQAIRLPPQFSIAFQACSGEGDVVVYLLREITKPNWSRDDRLLNVKHELIVMYYDVSSQLLFICSSRRTAGLYQHVIHETAADGYAEVPYHVLNRVTRGLEGLRVHNLGMRKRVRSGFGESYRTLAGPSADRSVEKSDALHYSRGHWFGSAAEEGEKTTIGLSTASKIWSNRSSRIPALVDWCRTLARKLETEGRSATSTGLDYLDAGRTLTQLPDDVISANWAERCYQSPPVVRVYRTDGSFDERQLLDWELVIAEVSEDKDSLVVALGDEGVTSFVRFSVSRMPFFEEVEQPDVQVRILDAEVEVTLIEFLNDYPLTFLTGTMAQIVGSSIHEPPEDEMAFDASIIESLDWRGVDITNEDNAPTERGMSIHQRLEETLASDPENEVVYYDHGSGEIADFIAVTRLGEDGLRVSFFHCKGSKESFPGDRVADVYEVCGQAVKSTKYADIKRLTSHVKRRFSNGRGAARFVRGEVDALDELSRTASPFQAEFSIVVVQPGLSAGTLSHKTSTILAATSTYLRDAGFERLRWVGSSRDQPAAATAGT